ncbi:hybrid sensor histidine kinase/response regulator [Chitinophaga japonensis]|uniref:histidine kinase n=1 Tax=Chitinophaga japonensis TaxID=104662 RepID=A0A562SUS6_CHIJA|nr:two-component regulator propeller domain-containing protein [Chitinophaga japonensis]TWI84446.1 signal transduction histidine kinase [Chitinophaga japonensis]
MTLIFTLISIFFPPHPPIHHLGIEQGLSNNTVRCIYQDHDGFMWFGTYDGLNRYDGYGFKVFRSKRSDTNSLVNNIITAITEDRHHFLWIGTRQGLSRYNPLLGKFTGIRYRPAGGERVQKLSTVIRSVGTDSSDNIFIGTEGLGLLLCRQGATVGSPVPLVVNGAATYTYGVHATLTDNRNRVWVLVQNRGLGLFDPATGKLRLVNGSLSGATCLAADGEQVWIGAGTAVYAYHIPSGKMKQVFEVTTEPLPPGIVLSLMLTRDRQELWISTETGNIYTWNLHTGDTWYLEAGEGSRALNGGAIHTMYEDKASTKWIGTLRGGINIAGLQKSRFHTIRREPGSDNTLSGNVVSAFYEAPDSSLWIGTDGNGLNRWNRRTNTFTTYTHHPADRHSLADNFITSLEGDEQQHVWIATYSRGIQRWDQNTGQFKHYPCINPVSGAENKVIFVLHKDRGRQLWACALRSGGIYGALYRYNPARDAFDMFDDTLSDLFVLQEDRQGNLWGGNLNQLVKIDRVNRRHRFYDIGHTVRAIQEDKNGHLWVGTEGGGLYLFDKRQGNIVTRYTTEDGLCNDAVLNMLDDGQGNLWLSTYNGLSKFNLAKRTFTNYYQGDGLQSNQFFYNAAQMLRSGEMAFGGIRGFSLFYPKQITGESRELNLVLTDLVINNTPLEKNEPLITRVTDEAIEAIRVPYNKAVFSFGFTALEYASPKKITYAYFMEGWDKGWNNAGNLRSATYTHLGEGRYTFRVRCTNAEGVWNTQEIALGITVLPPWYRSWWAYLLYAALLSGSVYLYFLYKMRQNRLKYEIRLANMNAQKERDLHEKKLSFFTHVSHEFRTPLTLIINPVKEMLSGADKGADPEELNIVYRNARRLLSLVDQLLHFRRADSEEDNLKVARLDFGHTCREVYLCFVQQARTKKIDYRFECPETPVEIYADREKIEIVLFNLVSNALKFTPPGGRVTFRVAEAGDGVQVTVTDSGCGIQPEVGDRLFRKFYQVKQGQGPAAGGFGIGLYLVKHFTERHCGMVSYESRVGEGTTFRLVLLKGKAHFRQEMICPEAPPERSVLLQEPAEEPAPAKPEAELAALVTERQTILVIDDDAELRKYVAQLFAGEFTILEAASGEEGLQLAKDCLPDVIISDITMQGMNGIAVCRHIKEDTALSHIPVILLTATTASESQLEGIESGADDYITKPFERELLKARVMGVLRKRNTLQQYFYNEITLKRNDLRVSVEYKEFLDRCIQIVESHLDDDRFSIQALAREVGMSHSGLYKKVKSVSGQSVNGFIRFIRLRKAAEIMIGTEHNIGEIAAMVGFNNMKYFRQHFNDLFGMNPSEYIRKFRRPFHNTHHVNRKVHKT